uniref:RING-type domain-containing protein n=1 Tax=Picea sitchensis TaxID=3332 RepID=A9P156_PICSI|nr:unknown [Picea sitchensis]
MMERMFMVVLSFLLLCAGIGGVVLVYLWLIWYVSLHEMSNRGRRPSEGNGKAQKQQGLSAADLQRLPTIECGKEEEGEERSSGSRGGGNAECAVCLEIFQNGDRCRVIPVCSHAFHVQCADAWLSKCSVCPICRRSAACESEEKNGVNDGAAAALQEESGRSHVPPPAESIVVDMPIAITPTDYRG